MKKNNNNSTPIKKEEKKKKLTSLIISFVSFLILLGLYYGTNIVSLSKEKISYNQFLEYVEENKVEKVDIDEDSGKMEFYLKEDEKTYYTNYPYSENFEEELLKKDIEIEIDEKNWLLTVFEYGFTPLVLFIFMFMFLRTMNIEVESGVVGKDNVKTNKNFDDVAGLDEIKDDMKFLAEMISDEKYLKSGVRIPRGVLLEGPPGNGKTLLAKAFASEAGVNFIAVNASDFGSKFIGVGSQKIKTVFENARKTAPCVIFIDELDAVGAKRSSGSDASDKEMNTMITALLNQMDGFKQMDRIMVLAATNRADELDEALVRPGRFDKKYTIGPPDRDARCSLFKLYTKNIPLSEDVDIKELAKEAYGYSCSAIECLVNEARILSIRENSEKICKKHFEDAMLQMILKGHIKKNAERTDEEKNIVAYHEAGHAVAAYFHSNRKVTSINAMPTTSGAGGFTRYEAEDNPFSPMTDERDELICLYAGQAAEACLAKDNNKISAGSSADIHEATKIAAHYITIMNGIDYSLFNEKGTSVLMEKVNSLLKETKEESYELIKEKWKYVEAVAKKLLETEHMTENDFMETIKSVS